MAGPSASAPPTIDSRPPRPSTAPVDPAAAHGVRADADHDRTSPPPGVGLGRSRLYLPELESLRGIAMLLVYWFHVDAFLIPVWPANAPPVGLARSWIRAGHTGVDLFFVLSAFLLALPFLEEAAGGPHVDLRRYARRRALRILPAYWLAVVIAAAACASRPQDLLRALPNLAFLGTFPGVDAVLYPYSAVWWSLSTEVQFYVLLPVLGWWGLSPPARRRALWVLALLLVANTILRLGWLPSRRLGISAHHVNISLLGRIPTFLVGIAAAELYRRHGARLREAMARSPAWRSGGADAALLVLLLLLTRRMRWAANAGVAQIMPWNLHWHTAVGILWAAVLLLLLLAPLRSRRLLVNPLLARCGELSYSVYLIHVPFVYLGLVQARALWPNLPRGWSPEIGAIVVALTVGCFALSSLTYRFVEVPFLRRKERWSR